MRPQQHFTTAPIAAAGLSLVSPSGNGPAGSGRRGPFAPWVEGPMLKPVIFEVAVMLLAASSYLYHREFGEVRPAAVQDAPALIKPDRAATVKTAVPDLQAVPAWIVPSSAVLHDGSQDYVFAQQDSGAFQRLPVQGHAVGADRYAITGGLDTRRPIAVATGQLDQPAGH
jgi:hypothetical protein